MDTFKLKSGDTEFNTRVDALFSSLQSAAKDLEPQLKREHEEEEEEEEEEGEDGRKRPCFSRPRGRPPQWRGRGGRRGGRGGGPRNTTPDFIKNPHNWKRYDMRDTKVLSDAENKREGLKLLSDLSARPDKSETEEAAEKMELDEDDRPKFIFKKPAIPPLPKKDVKPKEEEKVEVEEEEEEEEAHYPVLTSRKFHKPEYVVGKAKPKPKPKEKIGKVSKKKKEEEKKEEEEEEEEEEDGGKKKEVKLSYLMFEEED